MVLFSFVLFLNFLFLSNLFSQESFSIHHSEWKNLTLLMPKECKIQKSNNNIDIIRYKNRYYLAFRTARSHFPSRKCRMFILSSEDFQNWKVEKEFYEKIWDLREPRFFIFKDTLYFLYFTVAASHLKFRPEKIYVCKSTGNGLWSEPKDIGLYRYVPWRVREYKGKLYLSAYYGYKIYKKNHQADLRLFVSEDGNQWNKLSENPQIGDFSGEEGEFIFLKDTLFAVVRLEGFGSYLCKANPEDYSKWEKKYSKFKYDSSLLLNHQNEIYLFSRRNLDGECDKCKGDRECFPNKNKGKRRNLIRYSLTKKVTAVFYLNREKMELEWIKDFPSTGDNAFPAIAPINENEYFLVNYSSDINKKPKSWIRGQFGKTYLYYTKIKFEKK